MPSSIVARAILVLAVASAPLKTSAQEIPVAFSQVTWPIVEITDSATMDSLLFELFLEPLEWPERLQVIDVTRNGFGPDDLIMVLPSSEVFLVPEFVPEAVLESMGAWQPEVEYRMDSGNMPVQTLAGLLGAEAEDRQAESAILYDVVQAVERSYHDLPLAMLFQRDSVGFTFQLWDYNQGALAYTPRPEFVADSAVSEVLRVLQGVGYVPGQGVVGLGRSLESVGRSVARADQALLGVSQVTDRTARNLAIRTVLLGSYDMDRSGAIDSAREIDGPTCDVWSALDRSFPGFAEELGFPDGDAPYLGALVLSVSANVRAPAYRRILACRDGIEPPATDPGEISEPAPSLDLPAPVARFTDSETAADVVRRAGVEARSGAEWAAEVRNVLIARYDLDRSGRLEHPSEVDAIPCVIWQVVVSTRPTTTPGSQPLGSLPADLGFEASLHGTVAERVEACLSTIGATNTIRVPRARARTTPVPPDRIRALVTVPLEGLTRLPEEENRILPAKTVLLAMFDTDRSGAIDRITELDTIPCSVWQALDTSFPDFARRFGLVRSNPEQAYRGDLLFSIDAGLRTRSEQRIVACERGEAPPRAQAEDSQPTVRLLEIPEDVHTFMDMQTAASVARAGIDFPPGSAAWAAQISSILLRRYDLDASGFLDERGELDELPCGVWTTLDATYSDLVGALSANAAESFVGHSIGIPPGQGEYARMLLDRCLGR